MDKKRILFLIDDDADDQEFFEMALQKLDGSIELRSASDCVEGYKQLSDNTSYVPEYIFLDINMPRKNGLQCLPEIKKLEHLRNTKVIMYSTSSDEEMVQVTKQLGAYDFIVKPPKLSVLVNHLHRILENN